MRKRRVVSASLHTIEADGEVHDSQHGPILTYGNGGQIRNVEQAFKDFEQLEPQYPKELRLQTEDGKKIFIRHAYRGNTRPVEDIGGIDIIF